MKFSIYLIIFSVLIFLYPTYKLVKAITNAGSITPSMDMDNLDAFDPEMYKEEQLTDYYSSENFNLYIAKDYMSGEQANNYLIWIEDRFNIIIDYMGIREQIERDNKKIDIYLMDTPGTSFSMGDYFVVYYHLEGLDVSVHEMTHSIDFKLTRQNTLEKYKNDSMDFLEILGSNIYALSDDYSNFLLEQRAVLFEDKFGMGVGFPNYGLPINSTVYERIRSREKLPSLKKLSNMYLMMEENDYENSEFRYVIAGSFGKFIEKNYGITRYNQVLKDGYKKSFGKDLRDLEKDWLKSIKIGSAIQNIIMIVFAVIIIILAHNWFNLTKTDFFIRLPGIVVLVLGFLSWGYYLGYSDNDLWGLVFAIFAGSLIKIWKSKIAIISLWVLGSITVILPLLTTMISL